LLFVNISVIKDKQINKQTNRIQQQQL